MILCGQSGVGSRPEGEHTRAFVMPGGTGQPWAGKPSTPLASTLLKIGAAVMEPSASFIGLLSLLPVHTPTANCGVKPIVQASNHELVVPVLAATGRLGNVRYCA